MKNLLLLSNDTTLNRLFQSAVQSFESQIDIASEWQTGLNKIVYQRIDSVIVNVPFLNERCPHKIVKEIQASNPNIPIFIIMDQMDIALAISLTKQGVEYCYSRPFTAEQIIENIFESLSRAKHRLGDKANSSQSAIEISNPLPQYVTCTSEAAKNLYSQIDKVADTNFKVVIYGETGTGKESVARRLCKGIYKDKPFIAVDCGCLNKELAASELFGHKKGSFSGAYEDKVGAFEEAHGGTIFLDEIGNLDLSVQTLLLRAIEENKVKRIGSNQEIDIDARIIVASNERLSEAVEKGKFREDLFYRLNEFEICVPPLRERMEDLETFIQFFIQEANQDLNKQIVGVKPSLMEKLMQYDWPGNIRELKNTIRRGCLMASTHITPSCLSPVFLHNLNMRINDQDFATVEPNTKNTLLADDLKSKSILTEYLEIIRILKEENFNKTRAADRLQITRKTLYNKLKTFNSLHTGMEN